jgi:hypothetical protein
MANVSAQKEKPWRTSHGLVKGEWMLLVGILLITGTTTYVYTQNKLIQSEKVQTEDIAEGTPTPVPENPTSL